MVQVPEDETESDACAVETDHIVKVIQENCHQLWFYDHVTKTVRNKLNNCCLDLDEGKHIYIID